jgi:hypothetical protein
MDDMVAALMLDFYGTVVHDDDAVLTAICAQVASTLTVPVRDERGREILQIRRAGDRYTRPDERTPVTA